MLDLSKKTLLSFHRYFRHTQVFRYAAARHEFHFSRSINRLLHPRAPTMAAISATASISMTSFAVSTVTVGTTIATASRWPCGAATCFCSICRNGEFPLYRFMSTISIHFFQGIGRGQTMKTFLEIIPPFLTIQVDRICIIRDNKTVMCPPISVSCQIFWVHKHRLPCSAHDGV